MHRKRPTWTTGPESTTHVAARLGRGGPGMMADEEVARRSLEEHLAEQGRSGFTCKVNLRDPPDLLVEWEDGSKCGVEVTRSYLQVADPRDLPARARVTGVSKAPARRPAGPGETSPQQDTVSSASLIAPVRAFAERLGETTTSIRKRDYTLSLGPSPVDSLRGRPTDFGKQWQADAKNAILKHIQDDRADILRHPGVWLKPSGQGRRWTVAVSPGVHPINTAVLAMLRRALAEKVEDLPRWNGHFARRWLLLLNQYPLVSNVSEVETTVDQLLRTNADCRGFDGILWKECADRSLVSIPVSAGCVASHDGP